MTSSESLATAERARIAVAFGDKVRDNYGCSEFVAIAYDCGHGWLHVHADWIILEPVDADFQPTPPGQTSQSVLLTNLANHAQPILRYNLGDRILVNPEPCPCGSSLPAIRADGRTDDILRFTAPDGTQVPVLPLALWSVMKETPADQLTVRLETIPTADRQEAWATLQKRMHAYLTRQGLSNVQLALAVEPPVRDPRSGKFRHVWVESTSERVSEKVAV